MGFLSFFLFAIAQTNVENSAQKLLDSGQSLLALTLYAISRNAHSLKIISGGSMIGSGSWRPIPHSTSSPPDMIQEWSFSRFVSYIFEDHNTLTESVKFLSLSNPFELGWLNSGVPIYGRFMTLPTYIRPDWKGLV
jgi:hypothetical protein